MKRYRVKGYETGHYIEIEQRINLMLIIKQWMLMFRLATTMVDDEMEDLK